MTVMEPVAIAVDDERGDYVQWTPAVAGALAAAALAFVMHTFAAAIGLAMTSAAPTWRDASMALQLLSGVYLVLAAVVAFGVGGYIAGRMRTPIDASADETEFRDGVHGVLVWAIAMVLTVLLTWAAAQSLARLAAPSGGPSGTAQSVAGENIIAFDLDRLFRAEKRPQNADLELCAIGGRTHSAHHRQPPRHRERRPCLSGPPHCRQHGLGAAGSGEAGRHHHYAGTRQYPQGTARERYPGLHGRRGGAARRCGRLVCGMCGRQSSRRHRAVDDLGVERPAQLVSHCVTYLARA